jgi:hypothetical protein
MSVNSHDLPTTAIDLAQLMTAIASGYGVSGASRTNVAVAEWFRTDCGRVPGDTQLAHKSGSSTGNARRVCSVFPACTSRVMTDGSAGWSPIAAVSAAVWQYFEANP